MAAVVDALQAAGMQLMPAAAEAEVPQQPAAPRVQATEPSQAAAGAVSAGLAPPTGAAPAAPRGYEPDAAIVNYYQIGGLPLPSRSYRDAAHGLPAPPLSPAYRTRLLANRYSHTRPLSPSGFPRRRAGRSRG